LKKQCCHIDVLYMPFQFLMPDCMPCHVLKAKLHPHGLRYTMKPQAEYEYTACMHDVMIY